MARRDPYPTLPRVVDIGGEIFDLSQEANVNLSHKGRTAFERAFEGVLDPGQAEFLLRKYFPRAGDWKKAVFRGSDRKNLIRLLRYRIQNLKDSAQFKSHVVKNLPYVRYYQALQEIVKGLETRPETSLDTVKRLTDDEIFQLILLFAWFLAHPNEIPEEVAKEWKRVVDELPRQTVGNLLSTIRELETKQSVPPLPPMNYFKQIDMGAVIRAEPLTTALEIAKQGAVQRTPISTHAEDRLKSLMTLLHLKGYLRSDTDTVDITRLGKQLPYSSFKAIGGAVEEEDALSVNSIGQAMLPLFDYLRSVYSPIYEQLEQWTTESLKKASLPPLLLILHMTQQLTEVGVYHLKNVPDGFRRFLTTVLKETDEHVGDMKEAERERFVTQLFHLPKVRLSSLLRDDGTPATAVNVQEKPYLRFMVIGQNASHMTLQEFKERYPTVDSKVHDAVLATFQEGEIFLTLTDSAKGMEDIPMKLGEIDIENIKWGEKSIRVDPFGLEVTEAIARNANKDLLWSQVMNVHPHMVFNDAELALAGFMGLKERMPK